MTPYFLLAIHSQIPAGGETPYLLLDTLPYFLLATHSLLTPGCTFLNSFLKDSLLASHTTEITYTFNLCLATLPAFLLVKCSASEWLQILFSFSQTLNFLITTYTVPVGLPTQSAVCYIFCFLLPTHSASLRLHTLIPTGYNIRFLLATLTVSCCLHILLPFLSTRPWLLTTLTTLNFPGGYTLCFLLVLHTVSFLLTISFLSASHSARCWLYKPIPVG